MFHRKVGGQFQNQIGLSRLGNFQLRCSAPVPFCDDAGGENDRVVSAGTLFCGRGMDADAIDGETDDGIDSECTPWISQHRMKIQKIYLDSFDWTNRQSSVNLK